MREVVLITGCSGRIGFKAAERFSKSYEVVGFDVIFAGTLPDVEFVMVDIASDRSVEEGLAHVKKNFGNRIASVVHLAAYYSFSEQESPLYEAITVKGTERLLRGLKDFEVGQFIFSSTMLVHAPTEPGIKINENSLVAPKWAYPRSKVATEKVIHDMRGNIPTVILRIAGVYDDHCHSIPISEQIKRIYENELESHLFAGNLHHGASFVHMDDLIDALELCVNKRKELPQETVLLIGEDETMSYEEMQDTISMFLYNKKWKTWSIPKPLAKIGAWLQDKLPFVPKSFIKPWMIDLADDHYELDITQAYKLLGWKPQHMLRTSLGVMIERLKEDPITWYDENKLKMSPSCREKNCPKKAA
jgi:nucleoside-diphosphate-sugar epimerase